MGRQYIALSLELLFILEPDFHVLELLLGGRDVLTLVDLGKESLIEDVADLVSIFLIFNLRHLRIIIYRDRIIFE